MVNCSKDLITHLIQVATVLAFESGIGGVAVPVIGIRFNMPPVRTALRAITSLMHLELPVFFVADIRHMITFV